MLQKLQRGGSFKDQGLPIEPTQFSLLLLSDVTDEISRHEYITASPGSEYRIKNLSLFLILDEMKKSPHETKKISMNTSLESLE